MSTATAEALKVELQAKQGPPPARIDKLFREEAVVKAVPGRLGVIEVTISTPSIDRDRERIIPSSFKSAKGKRLPFVSQHDYGSSLKKQIGHHTVTKITDAEVVAEMTYLIGKGNDEADWAYMLATNSIVGYSVGFMPNPNGIQDADLSDDRVLRDVVAGKVPLRTYTDNELLETSQVVVGSNRDAIHDAVGKGLLTKAEGEKVVDLLTLFEKKDAPANESATIETFMEPERQVVTERALTFTMPDGSSIDDVLKAFEETAPEQKAPPRESIIIAKTLKVAAFGEGGPDEVVVLDVEGKDVWRGTPAEMVEALTTVHRTVNVTWNFDPAPFEALVEKITAHLDTALKAGKEDLAEMVSKLPNIPSDVATQSQLAALAKSVGTAIHDNATAIATQEVQKALSDPSVFRLNK